MDQHKFPLFCLEEAVVLVAKSQAKALKQINFIILQVYKTNENC